MQAKLTTITKPTKQTRNTHPQTPTPTALTAKSPSNKRSTTNQYKQTVKSQANILNNKQP